MGIDIKPDTKVYVIDWQMSRAGHDPSLKLQPTGSIGKHVYWDSNSDRFRNDIRNHHAM